MFFMVINFINISNNTGMRKDKIYSEFAESHNMPEVISLEYLEEQIEQSARQEEADNIVLAEDKRL